MGKNVVWWIFAILLAFATSASGQSADAVAERNARISEAAAYKPDQMGARITVGTGARAGSIGNFNVSTLGSWAAAMQAAVYVAEGLSYGQGAVTPGAVVVLLPGEYEATSAVTVTRGIEIVGEGRPNVTVTHSGAVGVFDVNALIGVRIRGISFTQNTFVADQVLVDFDPSSGTSLIDCQFTDNTMTFNDTTATGFAAGDEVIGLSMTNGVGCVVDNNTVYPNRGVTAIQLDSGLGNVVSNNRVRNAVNLFFPAILDTHRRQCYRAFNFDGESGLICRDNHAQNLGLADGVAGNTINAAFRFKFPALAKTVYEYGHLKVFNNVVEDCIAQTTCTMQLLGCRWALLQGNFFCFNGIASTAGAGFLSIRDANGDGTAGATATSTQIDVLGCQFHNPGTSDAAAIYIHSSRNVLISACSFTELYCAAPIYIDSTIDVDPGAGTTAGPAVAGLQITGCRFFWPTDTPATRHAIKRNGTLCTLRDVWVSANSIYTDDETNGTAVAASGWYTGTNPTGKFSVNKGITVMSTGVETASDIGTNIIMNGP